VRIDGLAIEVLRPGSIGVLGRFTHSRFQDVSVVLRAEGAVGWHLAGDPRGTGPYYDLFLGCCVQGAAAVGKGRGQIGWRFTAAETAPGSGVFTRGPNANVWFGGRTGQCESGWSILGAGNWIVAPTAEGCTESVFSIDHPTSGVGCVENGVIGGYVEGAAGVTVYRVGPNARGTRLVGGHVTSIGKGTLLDDRGVATMFLSSSTLRMPFDDATFTARAGRALRVKGAPPSIDLESDGGDHLFVRAGPGGRELEVAAASVGAAPRTLLGVGDTEARLRASRLRMAAGGERSVDWIVLDDGTPEGRVVAGPGSLCSTRAGRLFLKASGTGAEGWREK
jgi:hypothetical protein